MEPGEILSSARDVERIDSVARRNYGLDNHPSSNGPINFNIMVDQAAIQVLNPS